MYIDATFISTRRVDSVSNEAYYTVLGTIEDSSREVLGIYNNPTESAEFYNNIFADLKHRGLTEVDMAISDGLSGIENVIRTYSLASVLYKVE